MNESIKQKIISIETKPPIRRTLSIPLSEEERIAVEQAAHECNLKITQYVRALLLIAVQEK